MADPYRNMPIEHQVADLHSRLEALEKQRTKSALPRRRLFDGVKGDDRTGLMVLLVLLSAAITGILGGLITYKCGLDSTVIGCASAGAPLVCILGFLFWIGLRPSEHIEVKPR